jgi:hypothetical protein
VESDRAVTVVFFDGICMFSPRPSSRVVRESTRAVKVNCFLLSNGHYIVFLDIAAVVGQVVVFLWVVVPYGIDSSTVQKPK